MLGPAVVIAIQSEWEPKSMESTSPIQLDDLPEFRPFPTAATRVMAAFDDPNVEASDIAQIVQCDPAMALRLLSVANSSSFGFSSEIATVDQAIVVMGFRAAKSLIVAVAASAVFDGDSKNDRNNLWQHSLACAAVSRIVANHVGVCPNEAFLAAIVHDVGKLVFHDIAKDAYVQATTSSSSSEITAIEQDLFGITHTELGERYASEWGLPCEIADAIACHHAPSMAIGNPQLAGVVCLANSIVRAEGLGSPYHDGENVPEAIERSLFQIDDDTVQHFIENGRTEYEDIRKACA